MTRFGGILLIVFVLLAGCGYHLAGTEGGLPQGVSRISLHLFDNRTTEPYLDTILTEALTVRLMRQSDVTLVETDEAADTSMTGEIIDYRISASSFDSLDNIRSYRVAMRVTARLTRLSDGKILWSGETVRYEDFANSGADITLQEDLESDAQGRMAKRIAEDLSWQMATGFGAD